MLSQRDAPAGRVSCHCIVGRRRPYCVPDRPPCRCLAPRDCVWPAGKRTPWRQLRSLLSAWVCAIANRRIVWLPLRKRTWPARCSSPGNGPLSPYHRSDRGPRGHGTEPRLGAGQLRPLRARRLIAPSAAPSRLAGSRHSMSGRSARRPSSWYRSTGEISSTAKLATGVVRSPRHAMRLCSRTMSRRTWRPKAHRVPTCGSGSAPGVPSSTTWTLAPLRIPRMPGSRHGRMRAAPLCSGPAKRRSAATAGHGRSAASAGAIRGQAEPWRRPSAGLGGR